MSLPVWQMEGEPHLTEFSDRLLEDCRASRGWRGMGLGTGGLNKIWSWKALQRNSCLVLRNSFFLGFLLSPL